MSLKVCQYCGLAYESAMVHDCPRQSSRAEVLTKERRVKGMIGRLITLEGGEGCGKSTQAVRLVENLNRNGIETILTREPGGSPGAEEIRKLLVEGMPDRWNVDAEVLLFLAARADHIARTIRPAIEAGKWVVSDRFVLSSYAYQGIVRGFGHERVRDLHQIVFGGVSSMIIPDLRVILLDIDPTIGAARCAEKKKNKEDRFERFGPDFHEELRSAYLRLARDMASVITCVDASLPISEVANQVYRIATE